MWPSHSQAGPRASLLATAVADVLARTKGESGPFRSAAPTTVSVHVMNCWRDFLSPMCRRVDTSFLAAMLAGARPGGSVELR